MWLSLLDFGIDDEELARQMGELFLQLLPTRTILFPDTVDMLQYLKEKSIHLEVCPTSNIQTAVYDRMENHTADKIYNSGVSMSINTDARTISGVTLESEYTTLDTYFGWTKAHFRRCNLEAIEHAFVDAETKQRLRRQIEEAYADGESSLVNTDVPH